MSQSVRILEPEDIIDAGGGGKVYAEISAVMGAGVEKILIDLKNISFMDSYGLRMMVMIHQLAREHGTELYLCSLHEQLRIVLELSKMDKFFDILPDRAAFDQLTTK